MNVLDNLYIIVIVDVVQIVYPLSVTIEYWTMGDSRLGIATNDSL
jgi:hypothetical protein